MPTTELTLPTFKGRPGWEFTDISALDLARFSEASAPGEGGWTVAITGVKDLNTTRTVSINVSSDPTLFDTDGDGVSDQAERELATGEAQYRLDEQGMPYHPNVANNNPLRVYVDINDADRIVRPGQTLAYSTTIATGSAPFAPKGVLNVTAPSVLGGNPPARSLTITSGQTTLQSNLLVASNALSQTVPISSSVRARLADRTGPEWQWAPVTPEAALGGNASYPFRNAESTASRPDRQDTYLLNGLTTNAVGAEVSGDIRAYEIPGGASTTLDNDADQYGGDRLYKRGQNPARVACAADGVCLTVWDQIDNCNTVTFSEMKIQNEGSDHNTSGIEPRLYITRNNQPEEYLYGPAGVDHDTGDVFDISPDLVRSYCGDAKITVYEADSTATSEKIGSLDITPQTSMSGAVFINFKTYGKDTEVGVKISTQSRNHYHVAGAITGPGTGSAINVQRQRFGLTRLTTGSADVDRQDYRPVVASDGQNFLVAWERVSPRLSNAQIYVRRFTKDGLALGSERLVDSVYYENPTRVASAQLDLVWIGDRYRLAWKPAASSDLRMVDLQSTSAIIGSPIVAAANSSAAPRMAYDPISNRTLAVYRTNAGAIAGKLFAGTNFSSVTNLAIAPVGSEPRVAYHPTSQGWLVGWTNPTNAQFEYAALQPSGNPLLSTGSVQQTTWAGAGAINGGTSLSCPSPSAVPTADYRFEEQPSATTFIDRSGFNRNATIASGQPAAGAPGSDRAPLSDYAVAFDGVDDSLTVPNTPRGDFSVSFWARTSRNAGGAAHWFEGQGLVDGYKPTDGSGFGVALGAGKVLFGVGVPGQPGASATISTPASVADGNWHFFVATRERVTGALKLYMDDSATPVATGAGGTHLLNGSTNLRIGSLLNGTNFFAGDIDALQVYDTALSGQTARAIYNRTMQSFCLAAAPGTTGMPFARLSLDRPDLRGGRLDVTAALGVRVDADAPTSTVTSFVNGEYVQGAPNGAATTTIIGGAANDSVSGITKVEVSVNNGAWQLANGKATWTYALPVTQGSYTIRTRATDGAGNVESPGSGKTVIVDSTPPSGSITAPGTLPVAPIRGPQGPWRINITGSVTDPAVTAQNGSSVEVLLQRRTGLGEGAGWQPATLTAKTGGVNWSVSYSLSANLPDPTGSYTVSVRIRDGSDATTTNNAARIINLDSNGPGAALRQSDATRQVISNTLTLGGTISDTYSLDRMEARYTPITEVVALSGTALLLPLDERPGSFWYTDSSSQNQAGRCLTTGPCPVAGEAGRIGGALRFNGQALARVPHDQSIDFVAGESFGVGAWIKTSAAGLIMRKASTATTGYALQVGTNGTAALLTNSATVTGGPDLRDNQWHHVVGMVDRSTNQARLYIDGVLRGSQAFTGSVANSADLNLGGWSGAATGRFNGLIDQVTIWGRALGASEVGALFAAPATSWRPATLSARGANVASANWTSAVPAGLEGQYQIDLRGFDMLGNTRMSPNVWRGVIDTLAPRVAMVARATGAQYTDTATGTPRYEFGYACVAEDRHLDEPAFSCSNNSTIEGSRTFTEDPALRALFPDMVMRTGLSAAYFRWESTQTPAATTRACDTYGRCATATIQSLSTPGQQRVSGSDQLTVRTQNLASSQSQSTTIAPDAGLPQSVVISPTNESVVAATGTLPVLVAAESSQPLKEIKLTLDGSSVRTIALAQSEAVTRTERTVTLTGVAQGQHVLEAVATDWANNTQATPFRATFQVDTTPPAVTLATTVLEADDTLQQGSGMMRFTGAATDTLGLATVQLRVGDGAFTDVAFSRDGKWHTVQWLGHAPEGQSFLITVRAIDHSGRITEVSRTIAVNIPPIRPDPSNNPPDTAITSGPPAMSASNAATFGFAGADAKTPAASLRFECRVDSGIFTACTSPRPYTNLSDGLHTFQVRAFDEIGNADPTPDAYTWTVDTTPPETTLALGAPGTPPQSSNSDLARFTFSASDGAGTGVARIECQLDTSAWGACVSPRNYSELGDGPHTFRVRAVDAVGNVDPSPATYTWTINTTLYFAAEQGMKVRGLHAAHEDILQIDGADVVRVFFDGSDVGINNMKVDAFERLADGSLLFSFDKDKSIPKSKRIPGIDADDSDIVRLTPQSLGENTAGTWSMYFDASDVGLTTGDEDVDGITVLPDGKIL
ncbi:MAG: hypothetical protein AVDCRST_MAG93-2188, partial [uncultured Chloroflexia bacterium]